jgi:hypothetical protein
MPDLPRTQERLRGAEVTVRIAQVLSQQETTKYCDACGKHVRAQRPGTSRIRQLALTILTLGLWAIAWIVDAVRRPGWRCAECDGRVG